jgi:hypothetical protein
MPSCPNGRFCVAQPARVAGDAGAPSPYGMCAAQPTVPSDAGVPMSNAMVSFDVNATNEARKTDARACCYTWVTPCPGGRAYRDDDGRAVVASEATRHDWLDADVLACVSGEDAESRMALCDRWVREAAFEHASIASFARVTLDLLAVGAPASLVAAAHRAALDEVEHARIAFSLASAFAGRPIGPGPLSLVAHEVKVVTLERVVRAAVSDGCIGEAAAALALREEAATTTNAAMRDLLERMAEDEDRHAELAYATVAWALAQDPGLACVIDEELTRARDVSRARVVEQIAAPLLAS